MQAEKVLVTGADGYIASGLIPLLVASGYRVTGLIKKGGRPENSFNIGMIAGDPEDAEVAQAIAEAEVIVHLAGVKGLDRCVRDIGEVVQANILLLQKMLGLIQQKSVRVIFASTYWVYGPKSVLPYNEAGPVMPAEPYGWSKALAEGLLMASGVKYVIARLTNVFGYKPGKDYREVAALFMERALRGEAIFLRNAGDHHIDLISIDDLSKIFIKLMAFAEENSVVNVGSGIPVSIANLAESVNAVSTRLVGNTASISKGARENDEVLFADRWVDIKKLREKVDTPITPLDESLDKLARDLLAAGVA